MHTIKMATLATVAIGVALLTTGCPGQTNVFRMWVVNASDVYRITSVEISSNDDSDTREILGDGMIDTNRTGVFAAVSIEDFQNEAITVTIRGVLDTEKGVFDTETSVLVPDPVSGGLTVPIVVDGNTALEYDADYYPLDENSKFQMMLVDAGS